jgi:hypothetical protein
MLAALSDSEPIDLAAIRAASNEGTELARSMEDLGTIAFFAKALFMLDMMDQIKDIREAWMDSPE